LVSVLEDAFRGATAGLDLNKPRGRVQGFYVRRRAIKLAVQNPRWDASQLTLQLMAERAIIASYVTAKMATLLKGPDPKSPLHLDLATMAKVTTASSAATAFARAETYRITRIDWISTIIWRALAIHDDVFWKSTVPPREIATDALDEMVDRRLRVVERMTYNVNSGGQFLSTSSRAWSVAGPRGPWKDTMLVRMFEYPMLPTTPFRSHLAQMPDWQDQGKTIMFSPANGSPPVHVPSSIASSWRSRATSGGTIWVTFKPTAALTPAEVVRRMFEIPHENFLDRSWLFCDMVGAALSIEALWVGRARRDGNDAAFNAVMRKPDYISLGPVVRWRAPQDIDTLMADGADDAFFENTEIEFADLQVGDFVVFWNSRIYSLLSAGAWANEFSYVMDVDADPSTGKIRVTGTGPQVWLAGHGLHTSLYNAMASELTAQIGELLRSSRAAIAATLKANPATTMVNAPGGVKYVKWAPYEDFNTPGAWWLMIGESTWKDDWAYTTRDQAVGGIPRAIADDPDGGPGYRQPPDTKAIYFPLSEPTVGQTETDGDSWRAYLRKRKTDRAFRASAQLVDLTVDSRLALGLFYRGSQAKVAVVRPRVSR
jgi:hypothetical protein